MAFLDPVQGSEQAGTRPVLVVSRESINQALPVWAVLPMTTLKAGRRVYPTEVLVPAGTAGLPHDSLVLAHQVRTVARSRLVRHCGSLETPELRARVAGAMRLFLDLDGVD